MEVDLRKGLLLKKRQEKNGYYYLLYIIVVLFVCVWGHDGVQWALLGPSLDKDLILVNGLLAHLGGCFMANIF